MTAGEALRDAVLCLGQAGVESPQADAEWLIADLLSCSRSEIPLRAETALAPKDRDRLAGWVERRVRREPLQHILGTANFLGYDFQVSAEVLIPRPETEILVEMALQFLEPLPHPSVCDLGTGSGCMAVALAKRCPGATVIASDLSEAALRLAKRNAESLGALGQLEFRHAYGLAALPNGEQVDLILSNPPYIPTAEIDTLQPEVRDHDPRLALDGGADGLRFYRMLADGGRYRLRRGGRLMAEFGDGQEPSVTGLFRQAGWPGLEVANDLTGRPRIVVASAGQ
ncbi:MAG: peptide chain release factor N(5)-glutamine methyltransferase [Verrucomicrobia bacterium]|nr:peptide chain release factor N(5)-glutamine methyltransferase [Verrucomicrobiota bacterium]